MLDCDLAASSPTAVSRTGVVIIIIIFVLTRRSIFQTVVHKAAATVPVAGSRVVPILLLSCSIDTIIDKLQFFGSDSFSPICYRSNLCLPDVAFVGFE